MNDATPRKSGDGARTRPYARLQPARRLKEPPQEKMITQDMFCDVAPAAQNTDQPTPIAATRLKLLLIEANDNNIAFLRLYGLHAGVDVTNAAGLSTRELAAALRSYDAVILGKSGGLIRHVVTVFSLLRACTRQPVLIVPLVRRRRRTEKIKWQFQISLPLAATATTKTLRDVAGAWRAAQQLRALPSTQLFSQVNKVALIRSAMFL